MAEDEWELIKKMVANVKVYREKSSGRLVTEIVGKATSDLIHDQKGDMLKKWPEGEGVED
jgi:hypothetical protein